MKLNWFSPVRPLDSFLAQYTGQVVASLTKAATITVWTHESEAISGPEPPVQVRSYNTSEAPWAEINAADATIYHLGKDAELNAPIWRMFQQHPGIVVLHEIADRQRINLSGFRDATAIGLHASKHDAEIINPNMTPVICLPVLDSLGNRENSAPSDEHLQALLRLVEVSLRQKAAQAVSWISGRAGRAIHPWFSDSAAVVTLPSLAQAISRIFDER